MSAVHDRGFPEPAEDPEPAGHRGVVSARGVPVDATRPG